MPRIFWPLRARSPSSFLSPRVKRALWSRMPRPSYSVCTIASIRLRYTPDLGRLLLPPSGHNTIYRDGGCKTLPWRSLWLPELLVFGCAAHGIRRMGLSSCSLSPRKLTTVR